MCVPFVKTTSFQDFLIGIYQTVLKYGMTFHLLYRLRNVIPDDVVPTNKIKF